LEKRGAEMNFNQKLENLLSKNKDLLNQEGILLKQKIKALALSFDEELIGLLLSDIEVKEHFFKEIGKATIFDYKKFIDYIEDKNFLLDSYKIF
jgi:adenine-specific DNA-methyltransferase